MDTAFDKIVYNIRNRYCARLDADEEEEEKPKKKATGWGARLPYGLCKSLGIDATGMTPTEAWEAYEKQTGKTADETYKEKAEKGVGKVIYVEKNEPEWAFEEPEFEPSYTEAELESELGATIEDVEKAGGLQAEDDGYINPITGEFYSPYEGEKLIKHMGYYQKEKGDEPTENSSGALDYASMSQEELNKALEDINAKIGKFYEDHPKKSPDDLFTDDELYELDQLYDEQSKIVKSMGGAVEEDPFEDFEPETEVPTSEDLPYDPYDAHSSTAQGTNNKAIPEYSPYYENYNPEYTKEELEKDILGGTIQEFIDAGGFQEQEDGTYVNPLTAEVFSFDKANQAREAAAFYFYNQGGNLTGDSPKKEDIIQNAIKQQDERIAKITNDLKDIGFTAKDINGGVGNAIAKYHALGKFYDAFHKMDDWKTSVCESMGHEKTDDSWFYGYLDSMMSEEQDKWNQLQQDLYKASEQLSQHGVYDVGFTDGIVYGYDEDKVKQVNANAWKAEMFENALISAEHKKGQLKNKAKSLAETTTPKSPETPTPEEPKAPKKKSPTVKSLQKDLDKTEQELNAVLNEDIDVGDIKPISLNKFNEYIKKGYAGEQTHTIEEYFEQAQNVYDLYEAKEGLDKWLGDHGYRNGLTPDEAYNRGFLPWAEYKSAAKEYGDFLYKINQASDTLKNKYGYALNEKGLPYWQTKKDAERRLKWKDAVLAQKAKADQLTEHRDDISSQITEKQNLKKIKDLTKETKTLQADVDRIANEVEQMDNGGSFHINPYLTYNSVKLSWVTDSVLKEYKDVVDEALKDAKTDSEIAKAESAAQEYANLEKEYKKYKAKKAELQEAQKKLVDSRQQIYDLKYGVQNRRIFNPEAYTQERKDEAMWTSNRYEVDNALFDTCSATWKNASPAERRAAYDYTTNNYDAYNDPLRQLGTGKTSGEVPQKIKSLTNIVGNSYYDFDMWVQRGVGFGGASAFLGVDSSWLTYATEEELQDLIGKEPIEYGFSSCGAAKGTGSDSDAVVYNIYMPRGTKALYMEPFSEFGDADDYQGFDYSNLWDGEYHHSTFGHEFEILIQQGTRFRITKVTRKGKGQIYIDVEVISQTPRT